MSRHGLWLVGARGGLATTLQVGARAIVHGLCSRTGLVVERPSLLDRGLPGIEDLAIGGHDIREGTVAESALEIYRRNGSIRYETIHELEDDLREINGRIKPGVLVNSGSAIESLKDDSHVLHLGSLSRAVDHLRRDMESFREDHAQDGVVMVNLSSTEPILALSEAQRDPAALRKAIADNVIESVRSSTLYSLAAFEAGIPVINFTPSNAALPEAACRIAEERGIPYMGNDGKTGETLVKSALAPMFKYRALKVLAWQGYNMLGDRDGIVLNDAANKASKVKTKDSLLPSILGYAPHTHVAIDYVPSLDDLKTAWDFIHFQGFLDFKMSMQFTWHGCDAILAAPLVLDMARLALLAHREKATGPMRHLSCFFKSPLGVAQQDLHRQFHMFMQYLGEGEEDEFACGAPASVPHPETAAPRTASASAPAKPAPSPQ